MSVADEQRISEPAETTRRLRPRKLQRQAISVNVGIDFGTSSTKVFVRDLHHYRMYACMHAGNPRGYPPICLPSTVNVTGGRVYFGAAAEAMEEGATFRSFKMCLRCRARAHACSHCPNLLKAEGSGWFDVGDDEPVPAEELSAWYLAYVIGKVRRDVVELFASFDPQLSYQMAAPLGMVEIPGHREVCERALHIAAMMAGDITQGIGLADLRSAYQGVSVETKELPPLEQRVTFVQPETHAAMIGYAASRQAEDGLYGIVDIGAGTTDISFFRLAQSGDRAPHAVGAVARRPTFLAYYSTDTVPIGGDVVDREILAALGEATTGRARNRRLQEIRIAKQSAVRGQYDDHFVVNGEVLHQAGRQVGGRLFKEYKRIWSGAWEKERLQSHWDDGLTVFLVGGGSELSSLCEPLCTSPHAQIVPRIRRGMLSLPDGIALCGGGDEESIYRNERLLMVAYGLAHHAAESPDYFVPAEVEPLERPKAREVSHWETGHLEK